jgi:hypothetical protein
MLGTSAAGGIVPTMAQKKQQQKDVIGRLTQSGEDALQRLSELPGGAKLLEAANGLRNQVDDLTKKMRSLDPLEKRVAELERRLDALTKPKPTRSRTTTARRSTSRSSSTSRKPTS